jgi:hypothetical protein
MVLKSDYDGTLMECEIIPVLKIIMQSRLSLLQRNGNFSRRSAIRHIDLVVEEVDGERARWIGVASRSHIVVALRIVLLDVRLLESVRAVGGAGVVGLRALVRQSIIDLQVAFVLIVDGEGGVRFVEDDVDLAERRLVGDLRLLGVEEGVAGNLGEELRLDHVVTASLVALAAFCYGMSFDLSEAGPRRKVGDPS